MLPWQHSCFVPKWWLSWETLPEKAGSVPFLVVEESHQEIWGTEGGRCTSCVLAPSPNKTNGYDLLLHVFKQDYVFGQAIRFNNKKNNTKIWNMWRCTSGRFSRNLHWTEALPTCDGNVVTVAEESQDTSKPRGFYHYNPRSAAFSECQILRPVFFCFLWTCKRSVYWSLLPKVFPRFYPNIPFWKLLFWDFTKKERAREARGILLPSQDALLDGFFDHLQGGKKWKKWTTHQVLCFMHP